MFPFTFKDSRSQNAPNSAQPDDNDSPSPLPWQAPAEAQSASQKRLATFEQDTPRGWHTPAYTPTDEERLAAMETNEPKRRLIRDAKALCKLRKITQQQMADELGIPRRTLEEYLQFRRMPRAPGTTLLRRWMDTHRSHTAHNGTSLTQ